MEAQKVDMFIMSNGKFLEGHQMNMIRERLLDLDAGNHLDNELQKLASCNVIFSEMKCAYAILFAGC